MKLNKIRVKLNQVMHLTGLLLFYHFIRKYDDYCDKNKCEVLWIVSKTLKMMSMNINSTIQLAEFNTIVSILQLSTCIIDVL